MAFVSTDPETLEAQRYLDEAFSMLPESLCEKLKVIIDNSCKPAEFRMRNMKGDNFEIGRIIAVGIMLRMTLLVEEFPSEEEN